MKPLKIILVRHTESVGNVDKSVYKTTPDWNVPLTDNGLRQAEKACKKVSNIILKDEESNFASLKCDGYYPGVWIYSSEWKRAVQTAEPFVTWANETYGHKHHSSFQYREDPRIREQEWGNFNEPQAIIALNKIRKKFGTFHHRFPEGESGSDVYLRISSFLDTLHRDFNKPECPRNIVIFSHGYTLRIFLMRWFHWSFKEFENVRNPYNGQVIIMERKTIKKACEYHFNKKGIYGEKFELKSKLRMRYEKKESKKTIRNKKTRSSPKI